LEDLERHGVDGAVDHDRAILEVDELECFGCVRETERVTAAPVGIDPHLHAFPSHSPDAAARRRVALEP
jgi:hypothetical protein